MFTRIYNQSSLVQKISFFTAILEVGNYPKLKPSKNEEPFDLIQLCKYAKENYLGPVIIFPEVIIY